MAAVLVAVLFGVTACSAPQPIGVLKNGDQFTVVIGRQCRPDAYLSRLRIANYDRRADKELQPPLWEIEAVEPAAAVPSIRIGVVPEGFTEITNNIGTQGIGATIDVDVVASNRYGNLFDIDKMRDGMVLNSSWEVTTEQDFRKAYGCDR